MGLPWDAYYVLTKAQANLPNSRLHPNSGAPNYNIAHNVSDLFADADLHLGEHSLSADEISSNTYNFSEDDGMEFTVADHTLTFTQDGETPLVITPDGIDVDELLVAGAAIDYAYITGNDAGTDVTAAELEELTDTSETVLHSHAAAAVSLDAAYGEGSSIDVDATDVIWNLISTYDFKIQDNGIDVFVVDDSGILTTIGAQRYTSTGIEQFYQGPSMYFRPLTNTVGYFRMTKYGTIDNDVQITDDGIFYTKGNFNLTSGTGVAYCQIHFRPWPSASKDIGLASILWRDLFLSRNLSDGTNSLTIANAKTAYDHSQATTDPHWVAVPASAGAAGTAGDKAYASGFLYICVAADTWERVAIATW